MTRCAVCGRPAPPEGLPFCPRCDGRAFVRDGVALPPPMVKGFDELEAEAVELELRLLELRKNRDGSFVVLLPRCYTNHAEGGER